MPTTHSPASDDDEPLSKQAIRAIRKYIADSKDPIRYVIVSPIVPGCCLFYKPSDAVYYPNRIHPHCLFKRKTEAQAVAKVLNGSKRKEDVQVIAIRKTKKGFRILDQVNTPEHPKKKWKPKIQKT